MLGALMRYFQRRKLAFVVVAVPAMLKARYGVQATYTAQQVRRAIEHLRGGRGLSPYAFAACCNQEEFRQALPDCTSADYERFRSELVRLFDIGKPNFTCDHLRALRRVPGSNRWATIGDGQQGTFGGGVHYDGTMM